MSKSEFSEVSRNSFRGEFRSCASFALGKQTRGHLLNAGAAQGVGPQGLKPSFYRAVYDTAEAVPLQNRFVR
jgi:hypothetical protein